MVMGTEVVDVRGQLIQAYAERLDSLWAKKPKSGSTLERQWQGFLQQLAEQALVFSDEGRESDFISDFLESNCMRVRQELGLSLKRATSPRPPGWVPATMEEMYEDDEDEGDEVDQEEDEEDPEGYVPPDVRALGQKLLAKVGRIDFHDAEELVKSGHTWKEMKAVLGLSGDTVTELRNYFRALMPWAFQCDTCDKERGQGARFYRHEDKLLCFPCYNFLTGNLTERQQAIEAIRAAYNRGHSCRAIEEITGAHWRLVAVAVNWNGAIIDCHHCGKERGPGRQFKPWTYEDGKTLPTCVRCVARLEAEKAAALPVAVGA